LGVRGESVGILCKMVNKGCEDGQKWRTLPIWKFRFLRALYWAEETRRSPVAESKVAPVADLYLL
jgi:hypothetical protein